MTPVTGEPVPPPPAHQPPTNMVARLAGRLVTALRGSVHTIIARIDKVGQQAVNRWSRIDESISEKMSRTITPQRPTPSETEPLPLPQEPIPHEVLKGLFDGIIRTPLTFLHGGKQYAATLEGQTIQIQDTEDQSQLLRLTVDKGKIVTITTATSSPTEIPPAWKPVVDEFVGTCYERSSSYLRDRGGNVEIQVFREGVRSRAPSHAKNFLDTISLASDALPKPIGDALNSFLASYDLPAITQTVKDIQWYGATPERTKKLHDLIKTFKQLVRANQGKFRQFPEIERALSSISISLIELEDFINDPQRFPPPQGDTQYEEKKEAILTHIRFLWGKTFTNPNPNIEVKYRGQEGIDAGGLSRDFMNELMLGLIDRGNFVDHPRQPGIHDPETTAHFDPTQPFPSLDEGATNRFVQIGQLMMHCYRSCTAQEGRPDRFCITGRHFHESIFHAALCLTFDEVKTPFSNLSEQTKLKMARELLTHQEGGMSEAFSQAISCYEKLLNGSQLEKNEMKTLIANLEMTEALTLTEQDKQTLETDPNGFFNTHKDQMKGALANMVFGAVGHRLAPVHAMAQGMQLFMKNSKDSWEALCQRGGTVVSDTVQGKVDPQAVAAAITLSEASQADESMKKKVAWLKEWVQTLNPDEIKAFLQWVTGSQGFTGKRIIINKHHTPSPIPFTHTCFSQIDISPGRNTKRGESNDDTKEGFIAIVKSAIAASQQIGFEENVTR